MNCLRGTAGIERDDGPREAIPLLNAFWKQFWMFGDF
jgi:hypothetical protein